MYVPSLRRPNNASGPGAELGREMAAAGWICRRGLCSESRWDGEFGYGYRYFHFIEMRWRSMLRGKLAIGVRYIGQRENGLLIYPLEDIATR